MTRIYKTTEEVRRKARERRSKISKETRNKQYQEWYLKNKDSVLKRNKEWRKEHSYKSRNNTATYRLMIINLLRQRDGDVCGHCHLLIVNDFGIDHTMPVCLGGTDSAENLRLVHKICNIRRERQTYEK